MNAPSINQIVRRLTVSTVSIVLILILALAFNGREKLDAAAHAAASDRIKTLIQSNLPLIASDLVQGSHSELSIRLMFLRANLANIGLEMKIWDRESRPVFESDGFFLSVPDESKLQTAERNYASGWITSYKPVHDGIKPMGHAAFSIQVDQKSQSIFQSFVFQTTAVVLGMLATFVIGLQYLLGIRVVRPLMKLVDSLPYLSSSVVATPVVPTVSPAFKELDQLHDSLVRSYREIGERTQREKTLEKELAREQGKDQIARQVAHDIRSPLSALSIALPLLKGSNPDAISLADQALRRIRSIADDLLTKPAEQHPERSSERLSITSLDAIVGSIINEKHLEYRIRNDLTFSYQAPERSEQFVIGEPLTFGRGISNLINNATEAIDGAGAISVCVLTQDERVIITIEDSGRGIPPEVLSRVGERGFSFGKHQSTAGFGLGISQIKEAVGRWGGSFRIESQVDIGTRVTITLPVAK